MSVAQNIHSDDRVSIVLMGSRLRFRSVGAENMFERLNASGKTFYNWLEVDSWDIATVTVSEGWIHLHGCFHRAHSRVDLYVGPLSAEAAARASAAMRHAIAGLPRPLPALDRALVGFKLDPGSHWGSLQGVYRDVGKNAPFFHCVAGKLGDSIDGRPSDVLPGCKLRTLRGVELPVGTVIEVRGRLRVPAPKGATGEFGEFEVMDWYAAALSNPPPPPGSGHGSASA